MFIYLNCLRTGTLSPSLWKCDHSQCHGFHGSASTLHSDPSACFGRQHRPGHTARLETATQLQNHCITDYHNLEGTSGGHQSDKLLKGGAARLGCLRLCPVKVSISPRLKTPKLFWASCFSVWPPAWWTILFLRSGQNSPCCNVCSAASHPSPGHLRKSMNKSSPLPPIR